MVKIEDLTFFTLGLFLTLVAMIILFSAILVASRVAHPDIELSLLFFKSKLALADRNKQVIWFVCGISVLAFGILAVCRGRENVGDAVNAIVSRESVSSAELRPGALMQVRRIDASGIPRLVRDGIAVRWSDHRVALVDSQGTIWITPDGGYGQLKKANPEQSGDRLGLCNSHSEGITAAAFSADGVQVAILGRNPTWVQVCDVRTTRSIAGPRQLSNTRAGVSVALSNDGHVVVGYANGTMEVLDSQLFNQLEPAPSLEINGHTAPVSVAISPIGDIAAGSIQVGTSGLSAFSQRRMAQVEGNRQVIRWGSMVPLSAYSHSHGELRSPELSLRPVAIAPSGMVALGWPSDDDRGRIVVMGHPRADTRQLTPQPASPLAELVTFPRPPQAEFESLVRSIGFASETQLVSGHNNGMVKIRNAAKPWSVEACHSLSTNPAIAVSASPYGIVAGLDTSGILSVWSATSTPSAC
jgi:WD40 repeat protein